jgi:hypothetical protein
MRIQIEKKGLQTLLNTLISCRCPVTEETEKRLFDEYLRVQDRDIIDYGVFLTIADGDPQKTPVHLLFDFCSYYHDDPNDFTITHNDVIRYFCSGYHFNGVLKSLDPLIVNNTSSFLLGHLLLPATVIHKDDAVEAEYRSGGRSIWFRNMVFLPGMEWKSGGCYGVHLGCVVTGLTDEQVKMITDHLSFITGLDRLAEDITEIDFSAFQHYGDYRKLVLPRVENHFPARQSS